MVKTGMYKQVNLEKAEKFHCLGGLTAENCLLSNISLMISIVYLFQVIIGGDNFPLNLSLNLSIDGVMVEAVNKRTQLKACAEIWRWLFEGSLKKIFDINAAIPV